MMRISLSIPVLLAIGLGGAALADEDGDGDHDHDGCSPRAVVREFLRRTSNMNPEEWLSFFADDNAPGGPACYSNTGVLNPRGEVGGCYLGKAEIGSFFRFFIPILASFKTTVFNLTTHGHVVMVRRVDNQTVGAAAKQFFPTAKVGTNFDLQVMGFFTVEDCHITEWSDYFNTGDWVSRSGIPLPN